MSDARCIWLTEAECHFLDRSSLRALWDAAPPNATEAVNEALTRHFEGEDPDNEFRWSYRESTRAVLAALNQPQDNE